MLVVQTHFERDYIHCGQDRNALIKLIIPLIFDRVEFFIVPEFLAFGSIIT